MAQIEDEQRALSMPAAPSDARPHAQPLAACLLFQTKAAVLALEAHAVVEIVPRAHISRLPWPPTWVIGVAAVRGRVVPVIDLDEVIRGDLLGETTLALSRMIIAHHNGIEIALLAEQTFGLETLELPAQAAPTGLFHRVLWRDTATHVLRMPELLAALEAHAP